MTIDRMKFGVFMGPFHRLGENPTLGLHRDLELVTWLDHLGFDEAWIGEHHSAGWETIASPELFIATAAQRTQRIKLGTGVISLPYHHPLMVANRMVLLDHLTKGRIMMGVGPGALATDAAMLGIDPLTQRKRMGEAMDVIVKLLTETVPISHKSDWFILKDALIHLRPYTQPHFPLVVAAAQSPSGMQLAGKHGAGVLSLAAGYQLETKGGVSTLKEFWKIAEDTAAQHGKSVKREDWRLVILAHLAESRKEAMEQARHPAALYQRNYFEGTMGFDQIHDGPAEKVIDTMVDKGLWCIGTPDDLISMIKRLNEESGGFGGFLVQATEFGTREQVLHSYELLARYVMPEFQGSLVNLKTSQKFAADTRHELMAQRKKAIENAGIAYEKQK